tara:strand:- start:808 stop:1398 length:591 start_codon:yes stop_codon:yes gene_type:complete
MIKDIQSTITFILEMEKLKGVLRKIKPVGQNRYENSAEHSWQIALFALAMQPYANEDVDITKVLKMLLLHDIVEIDTGDTIVYDDGDAQMRHQAEKQAAKRLFALLPDSIGAEFESLWHEFENEKTPEAKYARGMDRVLPILQNLNNSGQSWVENGIRKEQVLEKNAKVEKACSMLWTMVKKELDHAEQNGHLKAP